MTIGDNVVHQMIFLNQGRCKDGEFDSELVLNIEVGQLRATKASRAFFASDVGLRPTTRSQSLLKGFFSSIPYIQEKQMSPFFS